MKTQIVVSTDYRTVMNAVANFTTVYPHAILVSVEALDLFECDSLDDPTQKVKSGNGDNQHTFVARLNY